MRVMKELYIYYKCTSRLNNFYDNYDLVPFNFDQVGHLVKLCTLFKAFLFDKLTGGGKTRK